MGVSLREFKEKMEWVREKISDRGSFVRLFVSSAEDLPFPSFEDCNKFPEVCEEIMKGWKRRKAFSIHYSDDTKLKVYIARLTS
jgi:hypothetical protein